MSEEQSLAAPGEPGPPKKKGVSPARNAIGLVALIAVVVIGVIQYTAMARFNSAVNALNVRMEDENKDLVTQAEAEALIGKAPDDAGGDVLLGTATYTRKTYTWKALLKSYTLAAYYTRGTNPALHHIESEGAKYEPEPNAAPPPPTISAEGGGPPPGMPKSGGAGKSQGPRGKGTGKGKGAPKDQEKRPADDKAKAGTDEKAKGPEPKPDEKAAADEKAKGPEPKADDKAKAAADETAKPPEKGS
jgi:hypothetical protein